MFCPNTGRRIQKQRFEVPLTSQRYTWVKEFMQSEPSITSVTDFGCGNGRINYWIKQVESVVLINYVDSNTILISENIYNFAPPFGEIALGRAAKKDLIVKAYHGDVCCPSPELKADCITLVELIEHMEPADLEVATRTLFGYYQPKFLIITTPNIEFNHLLKEPDEPPNQFRHDDHKFEWTREEFLRYGQHVTSNYPYTVQYDGVGHFPGKSEPFGPATQIALFRRTAPHQPELERAVEMEWCERMLDQVNMEKQKSSKPSWVHQGRARFEMQFFYPGRRWKEEPETDKIICW